MTIFVIFMQIMCIRGIMQHLYSNVGSDRTMMDYSHGLYNVRYLDKISSNRWEKNKLGVQMSDS